jgi:DNA polymerase
MQHTETLKEVLQFYADAGVDMALDEEPHNRLVAPKKAIDPAAISVSASGSSTAQHDQTRQSDRPKPSAMATPTAIGTKSHDANVAEARQCAASATSLDELLTNLLGFEGCGLKRTATNTVFEDGNRGARIMLVGEAPERDEDLQGKPFVGRSGQLLDKILQAVGLDRTTVYIGNILPWRPPGNRTPTNVEMELCKPFIKRQIELANPELLVFLGTSSAKNLLETTDGILKLRGKWRIYSKAEIPVMPTLPPAHLLRQPAQKRLVWRDFLNLRKAAIEKGILPSDSA